MPVTDVTVDEAQRTMTVTATFQMSAPRLWSAFVDPRQLERFWAPPAYSARFLRHDAFPGGVSRYEVYDDEDAERPGYWRWESVVYPNSFTVTDEAVDEHGAPLGLDASRMIRHVFTPTVHGCDLTVVMSCETDAAFEHMREQWPEGTVRAALGQIDQLSDTLDGFAEVFDTTVQRISPHQLRVSRLIRGDAAETWEAHVDPEHVSVWKTGQDGWRMPVCEFVAEPGARYSMEWRNELGGQSFGTFGEVLEVIPEQRLVFTERFVGEDTPESLHEQTFTSLGDTTLVTTVITYPSDLMEHDGPAPGVAEGFEEAYDRLERLILAG